MRGQCLSFAKETHVLQRRMQSCGHVSPTFVCCMQKGQSVTRECCVARMVGCRRWNIGAGTQGDVGEKRRERS